MSVKYIVLSKDSIGWKASLFFIAEHERSKPLVERVGAVMSHAGVAITITSITNFMAFGIGASSSLPALRSFCMFASIGILTIFFFQVKIIRRYLLKLVHFKAT